MKKLSLASLLSLFFYSILGGQTVLFNLGSNDLNVDSGSTASFTQDANSLTFNGNYNLGDTIFGGLSNAPFDLSSFNDNAFQIVMNLNGSNPNLTFDIELFDGDFNSANVYGGNTSSLVSGADTAVSLNLLSSGTNNMDDIIGFQYTWGGSGSVDVDVTNFQAVPEPAAFAGFAGVIAISLVFVRRRGNKR